MNKKSNRNKADNTWNGLSFKITNLPSEILSNTLLFLDPTSLIPLLSVSQITECVKTHRALWNSFARTKHLPVPECKIILKQRAALANSIKNTEETLRIFKTYQSDMTQLAIKNRTIFTSSDDQTIKVFGANGEFLKKFIGHNGGVWTFDLSSDMLVSGSTDKTARIWSLSLGLTSNILKIHRSTVRVVKCIGEYIITGSRDSTIAVWRTNGSLQHLLVGHLQSVRCLDADESWLVSGSYDSTVKLWDYKRGVFVRNLATHKKRVYTVKIQNGYVVSSGLDSEVKVTRILDGHSVSHNQHNSLVLWADFVGRYVVSSSLDGLVVKYDYINLKVEFIIQENSVIKHQKVYGDMVLIGTSSEAKIYSLRSGELIRILVSAYMITRVDMSEDLIAVGYMNEGDCYVSLFDYSNTKWNYTSK